MHFKRFVLSMALLCPVTILSLSAQEKTTTQPDRATVEKIVREYILQHPEVIAAVAVVGVAGAVSQGLLADCSEQDGNVNGAEIDAAFHTTVTIFNNLNGLGTQIGNDFINVKGSNGDQLFVGYAYW